jgi:hypothetical protein
VVGEYLVGVWADLKSVKDCCSCGAGAGAGQGCGEHDLVHHRRLGLVGPACRVEQIHRQAGHSLG